jgi:hypothetical protein
VVAPFLYSVPILLLDRKYVGERSCTECSGVSRFSVNACSEKTLLLSKSPLRKESVRPVSILQGT